MSGERVVPYDAAAVDAFVREQREARKAEEAERKRKRQLEEELTFRALAMGRRTLEESLADEEEHDRRRRESELAEWERRAAERAAERLRSEQVDEARRRAALENPLIFQY